MDKDNGQFTMHKGSNKNQAWTKQDWTNKYNGKKNLLLRNKKDYGDYKHKANSNQLNTSPNKIHIRITLRIASSPLTTREPH